MMPNTNSHRSTVIETTMEILTKPKSAGESVRTRKSAAGKNGPGLMKLQTSVPTLPPATKKPAKSMASKATASIPEDIQKRLSKYRMNGDKACQVEGRGRNDLDSVLLQKIKKGEAKIRELDKQLRERTKAEIEVKRARSQKGCPEENPAIADAPQKSTDEDDAGEPSVSFSSRDLRRLSVLLDDPSYMDTAASKEDSNVSNKNLIEEEDDDCAFVVSAADVERLERIETLLQDHLDISEGQREDYNISESELKLKLNGIDERLKQLSSLLDEQDEEGWKISEPPSLDGKTENTFITQVSE